MSIRDTKWFIIGTGIAWLVVDICLAAKDKPTISRVILDSTGSYVIPLILNIGFVLGHLFWPQRARKE